MRKVLRNSINFILVFSSLSSCARRIQVECPIDVPPVWREPMRNGYYNDLTSGFMDCDDKKCLTDSDAKTVVKNMQTCESIRKGLIDFIDDVNHSH